MGQQDLGHLIADADARIERGRRVLRHEADPVAAQLVEGGPLQLQQVAALEQHLTAVDPARGMAIAQQLQGDRRFAAAGFAHQPEGLAAMDGEVDVLRSTGCQPACWR